MNKEEVLHQVKEQGSHDASKKRGRDWKFCDYVSETYRIPFAKVLRVYESGFDSVASK